MFIHNTIIIGETYINYFDDQYNSVFNVIVAVQRYVSYTNILKYYI